jgi:hypothetical protein
MRVTTKKFTHVGICTSPTGVTKLRFSNDPVVQQKKLVAQGYKRVEFVPLPAPMEKLDAARVAMERCLDADSIKACVHVIKRFSTEPVITATQKPISNSTANILG